MEIICNGPKNLGCDYMYSKCYAASLLRDSKKSYF